ncbi:putative fatty acyl-CoA reductase CG5065 [Fopius arisanus]|uniref:Fatty acyl-CoA reductase n=2 Tax=Fopius arisanus TaxID=64838 RepID=A0A0C9QJ54_9HYME|nr:PREDICTED: putative fatty acyl-CoA reductase CG5065 [Fopius arisanus]
MKSTQDFSSELKEKDTARIDNDIPQEVTIPEWFRNRNVLITGATGFMGKVLLAKLLKSCPDVGKIYILVREKKGVDPQSRLFSLIQNEPFRDLQTTHPEVLKKVMVISGDVAMENLSLSPENRELLVRDVSVVFHSAANVKFDVPLKDAIRMNTAGVRNLIAVCKQMHNLQSLIYISTAYTHCGEKILEDRPYPSPMLPEQVISLVESLDDDLLEVMTPKLLRDMPNTYAFSKSLAEDLINRSNLPTGVARPSIVVASWKEPVPGWVENLNGPTGLMIGAAKGVVRSVLCDENLFLDAIPCDIAVNAIIALAWKVGRESPVNPIYMNVTESGENPLTWGQSLAYGRKHAFENPFTGILWYPRGGITNNQYYHMFRVLFFHLLPAYFIDALCFLTGHEPFLVRVQHKVSWGLELLQYYTLKEWDFKNDRMKELRDELLPADKNVFYMDTKAYDWNEYMKTYVLGARRYILKEDPSTLPQARRIFLLYWIADLIFRFLFIASILWLIYSKFTTITSTIALREVHEF